MTLSELKRHLNTVSELNFITSAGTAVPAHFHITEAGLTTKNFVDCGGTVRTEKSITFQVWVAEDYEHRLTPDKMKKIVGAYERFFGEEDLEVEVEYQTDTIGRYSLDFRSGTFLLKAKHTTCLAEDLCTTSPQKLNLRLSDVQSSYCEPGGQCC